MYIPGFNLCHANSSWTGFHTCLLSLSFIDYLRCRNNWRFFKNTVIKQVLCIFTTLQLLQWRWKQSFASLCRKLCRSFIFFSDGRWCGDVVLSCSQVWFPEFHTNSQKSSPFSTNFEPGTSMDRTLFTPLLGHTTHHTRGSAGNAYGERKFLLDGWWCTGLQLFKQ